MGRQPECRFYVHFSKLRGPTVTFENQKYRRYFALIGWLWNTDDKNFDRKPFELTVEEGNWPDKVADWRRWDAERGIQRESPTVALDGAIGYLRILEGAQPKIHVTDNYMDEWEEPPFQAAVYLERNVYGAAEKVCRHALASGDMVSVCLDASISSSPNRSIVLIHQLDYSRELNEQITGIEFNPGAPIRPVWWDDYVKPPKIDYNSPKLNLGIAVASCRVSYSVPKGRSGDIELSGWLPPGYEQSSVNSVSIALKEYEKDNKGSYPKESFSGRFEFHHENGWLSLELYYRSTDIEGPLRALLSARDEDKAAIDVTLLIDPATIRDGGKDVDGHVGSWGASVFHKRAEPPAIKNTATETSAAEEGKAGWWTLLGLNALAFPIHWAALFYTGWCLTKLWAWFIAPLGVFTIETSQAVGIMLTIALVRSVLPGELPTKSERPKSKSEWTDKMITQTFLAFFLPSVTLLVAYLVKSWFEE